MPARRSSHLRPALVVAVGALLALAPAAQAVTPLTRLTPLGVTARTTAGPGGVQPSMHGSGTLCLRIVDGVFDAPGDDARALNQEWVALRNECQWTVGLGGWVLRDRANVDRYTFPPATTVGPGATLHVRSGAGVDTATTRYWARATEVWANRAPETAVLVDPGAVVRFVWSAYTDRVLVGAGDIAECAATRTFDSATARLIDGMPLARVWTVGDNAYRYATPETLRDCYGPTWGRHRLWSTALGGGYRTRPALGNHEYPSAYPKAGPSFDYFGGALGPRPLGYYSYDVGAWHVIVLNSNCARVGGCGPGSPQERWLRADLAAHPTRCTLAMWHHPRFSSGTHGSNPAVDAFWRALHERHADVVLAGHDHDYERFARQRPDGIRDPEHGIREFVVGTGGRALYRWGTIERNSEVRLQTYGVLRLRLASASYDWAFLRTDGTVADSGSERCH
jgi:acid phosphatase type 7